MAESISLAGDSITARLAGKVAMVTGGSRGIGFAIARALAAEACSVIITGRNERSLLKAADVLRAGVSSSATGHAVPQVMPTVCDLRDASAIQHLFERLKEQFGLLDILVNNAGISQSAAPVEETSIELWREIIDINLTGTFLCSRLALPLMNRGGTILNVISIAAEDCFANYAPYNASKAGALAFTRTLREELKHRGIRVTALVPGATNTDIWEQVMPDAPREGMIETDTLAKLVVEAAVLSPKANLTELRLDAVGGPF